MRCFLSTGANRSACWVTFSEVPRNRKPPSRRAKWNTRDDLRLELTAEIDQEVAAGDQVDARERRIAHDAVCRKDAQIPQLFAHRVAHVVGRKEPLEPPRRHASPHLA